MKLRNKKTRGLANCEPIEVKTDAGFHDYHSLAELNEEWEDAPKEPLIKDEKIRKAVRAWAEVNELEPDYEVKYNADTYGLNSWQADINFNYRIEGLEHNKKYTIDELCGEVEE